MIEKYLYIYKGKWHCASSFGGGRLKHDQLSHRAKHISVDTAVKLSACAVECQVHTACAGGVYPAIN